MSIGNGPANNLSDLIYTAPALQCLNLSHFFASTSLCSASYLEINASPIAFVSLASHILEKGGPVHQRTRESISLIETNGGSPLRLHIFVRPLVIIITPPLLNQWFWAWCSFPAYVPCIPFSVMKSPCRQVNSVWFMGSLTYKKVCWNLRGRIKDDNKLMQSAGVFPWFYGHPGWKELPNKHCICNSARVAYITFILVGCFTLKCCI